MDTYFVRRDARGSIVCATCMDREQPATHVATYEKTDGSGRGAWALCEMHAPMGLIAWGALTPIADFEASQQAAVSTTPQPGTSAASEPKARAPQEGEGR